MARARCRRSVRSPARSGRRATPRARSARRRRARTGSRRRGSTCRRGRSARRRSPRGRSPARSIRFSLSVGEERRSCARPATRTAAWRPSCPAGRGSPWRRAGGPTASGRRPGSATNATISPVRRQRHRRIVGRRGRDRRSGIAGRSTGAAPVLRGPGPDRGRDGEHESGRQREPRQRARSCRRRRRQRVTRAPRSRRSAIHASSPIDVADALPAPLADPSRGIAAARDRAADAPGRCARSAAARGRDRRQSPSAPSCLRTPCVRPASRRARSRRRRCRRADRPRCR